MLPPGAVGGAPGGGDGAWRTSWAGRVRRAGLQAAPAAGGLGSVWPPGACCSRGPWGTGSSPGALSPGFLRPIRTLTLAEAPVFSPHILAASVKSFLGFFCDVGRNKANPRTDWKGLGPRTAQWPMCQSLTRRHVAWPPHYGVLLPDALGGSLAECQGQPTPGVWGPSSASVPRGQQLALVLPPGAL